MLGNLRALFSVIGDIALLRRGPDSLPASTVLMAGAVALYLAVYALMMSMIPNAVPDWPLRLLVGTVVTLLFFDVAFRVTKKRERFVQTVTAMFGVSTLFLPALLPMSLALIPYVEKNDPNAPPPFALLIVTMVLAVWMFVVQVRIVRAAFEWPTFVSVAFMLGQTVAGALVFVLLFGVPMKSV